MTTEDMIKLIKQTGKRYHLRPKVRLIRQRDERGGDGFYNWDTHTISLCQTLPLRVELTNLDLQLIALHELGHYFDHATRWHRKHPSKMNFWHIQDDLERAAWLFAFKTSNLPLAQVACSRLRVYNKMFAPALEAVSHYST